MKINLHNALEKINIAIVNLKSPIDLDIKTNKHKYFDILETTKLLYDISKINICNYLSLTFKKEDAIIKRTASLLSECLAEKISKGIAFPNIDTLELNQFFDSLDYINSLTFQEMDNRMKTKFIIHNLTKSSWGKMVCCNVEKDCLDITINTNSFLYNCLYWDDVCTSFNTWFNHNQVVDTPNVLEDFFRLIQRVNIKYLTDETFVDSNKFSHKYAYRHFSIDFVNYVIIRTFQNGKYSNPAVFVLQNKNMFIDLETYFSMTCENSHTFDLIGLELIDDELNDLFQCPVSFNEIKKYHLSIVQKEDGNLKAHCPMCCGEFDF